jgi:hypothetical protein
MRGFVIKCSNLGCFTLPVIDVYLSFNLRVRSIVTSEGLQVFDKDEV